MVDTTGDGTPGEIGVAPITGRLAPRDRGRLESVAPLGQDVQPVVTRLASLRDWQDIGAAPGWEIPARAKIQLHKLMAGNLPAYALADGGWVLIRVHGTFTIGSDNPNLWFRVRLGGEFVGPEESRGLGFGFTNSLTPLAIDGRFLFELRLHALGRHAPRKLFSEGRIKIGGLVGGDGTGKFQEYDIWGEHDVAVDAAQPLTLDVGAPLEAGGSDRMHVDGGDMFLFGGRGGHEFHT